MKNNILLLLFLTFLVIAFSIYRNPAVMALETISPEETKIKEIKEYAASIAGELRQNEPKILKGKVKENKTNLIILLTEDGEKDILTDRDTNFYWVNSTGKLLKITSKDVEKDDFFSVSMFLKNDVWIAKSLIGKGETFSLGGKILDIDKANKNIKLSINNQNKNYLLIQTNEKTSFWSITRNNDLVNIKFSDFKLGAKIFIRGSFKDNNNEEFLAFRLVSF